MLPPDLKVHQKRNAYGGIIAVSHRGLRRSINEDSFGYTDDGLTIAVADGLGGHDEGEVAAQEAIRAVVKHTDGKAWEPTQATLRTGIAMAHLAVDKIANGRVKEGRPATTLVAARFMPDFRNFSVGWVGDSRAYAFTPDGELKCLTRDHSAGRHFVNRVIGDRKTIKEAYSPPEDVEDHVFEPKTVIMLCSDGLCGEVDEDKIKSALARASHRRQAARLLMEAVFVAGARDNATIVMVRTR